MQTAESGKSVSSWQRSRHVLHIMLIYIGFICSCMCTHTTYLVIALFNLLLWRAPLVTVSCETIIAVSGVWCPPDHRGRRCWLSMLPCMPLTSSHPEHRYQLFNSSSSSVFQPTLRYVYRRVVNHMCCHSLLCSLLYRTLTSTKSSVTTSSH